MEALKEAGQLLGMPLDAKKEEGLTTSLIFLGMEMDSVAALISGLTLCLRILWWTARKSRGW